MKRGLAITWLTFLFSCFGGSMVVVYGQVNSKDLKPFIENGYQLVDTSGPGLSGARGDILLVLRTTEDYGAVNLVLLRKEKGTLQKVAENGALLPSHDELGEGGGLYPSLVGNSIFAAYSIGSGSAMSDISCEFQKGTDGHYYFKQYHSLTTNYGIEDLFARERITAAERKRMTFNEATMELILNPDKKAAPAVVQGLQQDPREEKLEKYVKEGMRLATYATGDLNKDGFKEDAVMLVYNKEVVRVLMLLQQPDGSYKVAVTNGGLFLTEGEGRYDFNPNNFKLVVKNGYFTIERRVPVDDDAFQHWYITYKYGVDNGSILLHRFDVEAYQGFDPEPSGMVMELTQKDFGELYFEKMTGLPGIYSYEPKTSIIQGILTKKLFYGRPNYGQSPATDEKVWAYVLKTDYPVNVFSFDNPLDNVETKMQSATDVREIQVYSKEKTLDLSKLENRKIKILGVLQPQQTGHHYTKVLLRIDKIVNGS